MKTLQPSSPRFWTKISLLSIVSYCLLSSPLAIHAQEKEQVTIKNKTFAYEVTKETTAKDLEQIQKEINDEKVAKLSFSNIKRNNKNEIVGLTTQFNDENGSSQQRSEYNSQGIRPFAVKIHENANGYKYLEIASANQSFSNAKNSNAYAIEDLFSTAAEEPLDLNSTEMMDMMRTMQKNMEQQQEVIMKLFEEAEKQNSKQ